MGIVHISCLKGCLRVTNSWQNESLQETEAEGKLLMKAAGKTEGGGWGLLLDQ
jgi:hypothetical protein